MLLVYFFANFLVASATSFGASSSKQLGDIKGGRLSAVRNGGKSSVIPNAYIIQLSKTNPISLGRRVEQNDHALFHKRASSGNLRYTARRQFENPDLFYGLSITVQQNETDAELREMIRGIEGVEGVWPVTKIKLPKVPNSRSRSTDPVAGDAYGKAKRATTTTSALPRITGTSDIASPLKMSGVDKLHALGINGKGMKIGIIDTGVDYRHPALGAGFGSGHKIAGGYSYVDDNGNSVLLKNPLATCFTGGHGTHVAGIVGMQDPAQSGFGLVGVAPEASLYMYRVFDCFDNSQSDDIISAMNQALKDGVDVVSMSLGQDTAFESNDPFTVTTDGLVAAGVAVIVAAGNTGTQGIFDGSSPAIGPNAIAIGSVDNTQFALVYNANDSLGQTIPYASVWPIPSLAKGRDVYILTDGTGCSEAAWKKAASPVKDKAETMIVFSYSNSDCSYTDKETWWLQYGFRYIMDYLTGDSTKDVNNQEYDVLYQQDNQTIYSNLAIADGPRLVANYAKAGGYSHYKMNFTNQPHSTPQPTGGLMSYYSTMGPSWDTLELKPQFSAPGGNILSTWPLGFNSGYAFLSGTSMATPFAAGCYALVKSQFPKLSVQQIRELLQSTAVPIKSAFDKSLLTTVVQQGSGLINPYNAIFATSAVSPSQLQIGDIDTYLNKKLNFTISNKGTVSQTYTFSHNGAGLISYSPFGPHAFVTPDPLWSMQPQTSVYASLKFTTTSVTLAAGKSSMVYLTITPPTNFVERNIPVISGFINVTSSTGGSFVIPYGGLPYSLYNATYIDTTTVPYNDKVSTKLPTYLELNTDDVSNFTLYDGSGLLVVDKGGFINNDNILGPLFSILQPSPVVRVDVFPANTTYKPDLYGYDPTKTIPYWPVWTDHGNPTYTLGDGTPTYGLIGVTNPWMPYSGQMSWFEFTVVSDNDDDDDDGGQAPTSIGDYRLLLSVLRWGGDYQVRKDYQTWLGPVMRVNDTGLTCWKKPTYYCGFPRGTVFH